MDFGTLDFEKKKDYIILDRMKTFELFFLGCAPKQAFAQLRRFKGFSVLEFFQSLFLKYYIT